MASLVASWNDLPSEVTVAWGVMALAGVVLLGFYLIAAGIWWMLLRSMGSSLHFIETGWLYFLNNLSSYIPGKVMSVAIVYYFGGADPTSRYRAGGATVLFQVFVMLSASLVVIVGYLSGLGRDVLSPVAPALVWFLGVLSMGCVMALVPAVLRRFESLSRRLIKSQVQIDTPSFQISASLTVLWVITWVPLGVSVFLFARSLYPGLGTEYLVSVIIAWCAAYLLGFLAFFTPSGLGIREASLALLLGQLMPPPVALMVALSSRLWILLITLVGTALMLSLRPLCSNQVPEQAGHRA